MKICGIIAEYNPFHNGHLHHINQVKKLAGAVVVVMSGHVVGDNVPAEVAELTRVTRSGGWLLDVPGDQHCMTGLNEQLAADGWEELPYTGTFGETTYRYRKQVRK